MGKRIFILGCLSLSVIIVAIMAFTSPVAPGLPQNTIGPLKALENSAGLLPPINAADNITPSLNGKEGQNPSPGVNTVTPQTTLTPSPTPVPTQTITPAPTQSQAPSPTPTAQATPFKNTSITGNPLSGYVIGVDPGHQQKSNSEMEPQAPGSSVMKKKVSSGTQGIYTRTPEHAINLSVGLLLRDMLVEGGATVIMTRTTADVNISNVERAQLFNNSKVDLGVRLHCNGSTDNSVTGAFMLIPKENPYLESCKASAKIILEEYGKATGIGIKKGITVRSDQTGFNWCERAIVNIEMGHLTNKEEDIKLSDGDFQVKMARGIYNGIAAYFTS